MSDKERIEEIQRLSGLNWKELAIKVGLTTPQTFTDIRSGRHGISKGLAAKMLMAFPDIRQEWLVFGTGPMTKHESARNIPLYEASEAVGVFNEDNVKGGVNVGSCFPQAEMAMRYLGDSMSEYPHGSILILRRVGDAKLLVPGNDYVVETKEFCVVKRLQKGKDDNHISLYSTNTAKYPDGKPIYEPFEVPMEAISRVFSIIGYIYTQAIEIIPAKA